MTEILLTVIIILLIINIVIALTKNNRLQTERLEGLLREEMKENRDELGKNIRELRNELNQTLNYSIRNMQDTLHKNLLTGNEMQREKFEAMGKQQEALVKSTEKRLDDMRQMVEEKLQKTLNERIGQSFEIVRSQLENVQKGFRLSGAQVPGGASPRHGKGAGGGRLLRPALLRPGTGCRRIEKSFKQCEDTGYIRRSTIRGFIGPDAESGTICGECQNQEECNGICGIRH